jgi:Tol biopolymer transport system component
LSGEAIPLSENIWYEPMHWGSRGMAVSGNNLLAYIEGSNRTQLLWFDRNGNQEGALSVPDQYTGAPSFSPDGKKFAMRVEEVGSSNIWLYDSSNGNRSRLTFASSYYHSGVYRWSKDGTRILFSSNRTGPFKLYTRDTSGAGNDEMLYESKNWCLSEDWSPDNRYIIFTEIDPKTKFDLWILSLSEPKKAFPFLLTDANEGSAKFSPDGKWIAYSSDESGRAEVYVQPFLAEKAGKWLVSTNGGFNPKWSRDGKEIFYLSPDNQIMSSEVNLGTAFETAVPKPLFVIHPMLCHVSRAGG